MIKFNGKEIKLKHFPDHTFAFGEIDTSGLNYTLNQIHWHFENNEELVALIFLARHIRNIAPLAILELVLPYIPNARMDRVESDSEIFTLKYFAEIINSLCFDKVKVLDPHSRVSTALIDRVEMMPIDNYIHQAIQLSQPTFLFYPDEGAMKRYAHFSHLPYAFGIKMRDWSSGKIKSLAVAGDVNHIVNNCILIIDDICSKGGTFIKSAEKLRELGAADVQLYVTHCEDNIHNGDILKTDLISKVYTTNSILTKKHEKIEVFEL